jgi:lysine 2,3-aminomutase
MEKILASMDAEEPPSKPSGYSNVLSDTPRTKTISLPHPNKYFKLSKKQIELPPKINRNRLSILKKIQKGNLHSPIGISEKTRKFRDTYYPEVSDLKWNNWHWQVSNRIRTAQKLAEIIDLSESEKEAISGYSGPMPFAITPYYASLLDKANPLQPIRRTVVMAKEENILSPGEAVDPLGEEDDSPVPGLVHRYPDRVLFMVTEFCSVYCRYCTRSRMVGSNDNEVPFNSVQWKKSIEYISQHPEIRDVIISGGDPLTLSNDKLEWLLSHLSAIPHIEMIRLGTKVPSVLPQRITNELIQMIKKYHPIWMSIHFAHPDEITPEVAEALKRLADAGIPLGSQTVLLKGVNDSVDTMKTLVHKLVKNRVKPYYLYQCDPVAGTSHLRTTVSKGLEIIAGLRGHTSGYAVPNYVIDAPGGGGKIPILPEYFQGKENGMIKLKNYEGKIFYYPDVDPDAPIHSPNELPGLA